MMRIVLLVMTLCHLVMANNVYRFNLGLDGVDCTDCDTQIKEKLFENESISSVNVNLTSQTLIVFGTNDLITQNIIESIETFGFDIRSVSSGRSGIKILADGIVCAFCIRGMQKRFLSLPEVIDAQFDIEQGELVLTIIPDKTISIDTINDIYLDAGYNVKEIQHF